MSSLRNLKLKYHVVFFFLLSDIWDVPNPKFDQLSELECRVGVLVIVIVFVFVIVIVFVLVIVFVFLRFEMS